MMLIQNKNNVSLLSKRKKSSSFNVITFVALIIVTSLIIVLLYNQNDITSTFNNTKHKADIEHYKDLLLKAKELSEKYKRIIGTSSLPKHLIYSDVSNKSTSYQLPVLDNMSSNKQIDNDNIRDLVLGMAQDTDAKNLAVFCKSLRRVSNASAIIFVNEPIPEMHKKLSKENFITLVPFNLLDLSPTYLAKYHPSTLRWLLFQKYLKLYKRIWMIDVRDSYFQQDPFEFVSLGRPSFHVFNGVEDKPIGQCSWNAGWIKDCFGVEMIQKIGNKNIICSGVSVGTADVVIEYLDIMSNIVSGDIRSKPVLQENLQNNFFPSCERNGVDQGVHNVLVHNGHIPYMKLWTQRDGPVANMQAKVGMVNTEDFSVVNSNGEPYAVVHQYDRNQDLQRYLFKKYVDWIDTSDLQSEWEYESSCMKYSYEENVDLFKGVCDLKVQGGATSAASCCGFCNKITTGNGGGCMAFTYLGGQCFLKSCTKTNHPTANNRYQKMTGAVSAFLKSNI